MVEGKIAAASYHLTSENDIIELSQGHQKGSLKVTNPLINETSLFNVLPIKHLSLTGKIAHDSVWLE